ncbi:NUDIX hydrolase [Candidatus Parcubacteria bacterium]|nr:MAG: NUDIX hydrolase [Candidatus Parcubacteria bacterium]
MANTSAWLSDRKYRSIYRKVPRLCVDLVIRDARGIILSRRDIQPDKGMWHLPGGRVRMQEQLPAAIRRIAREETGLKLAVQRIVGVIEYRYLGRWQHSVSVVYLARPIGGRLRGSAQAQKIAFFKSFPRGTMSEVRSFLGAQRIM